MWERWDAFKQGEVSDCSHRGDLQGDPCLVVL